MTNHHVSAVGKLLVALLLHVTFSISHASAQSLTQTGITKNVNYAIGGYYECLPPDYKANSTKKYPLMIFIHGIGELGDGSQAELPRVLKFGIPKLIDKNQFPASFTVGGQTSSFIVISPQFRDNYRDADAVKTLIDYCVANYRVDESRIYLTGLSMGGGISWIYAGKSVANAQRLAAMMVVCGNTNSSTTGINNLVAASLPVWATHNSNDPIVGSYNSINWINGLNGHSPAITPKALLNIFNSTSHDAWTKTYDPAFKPNGLNVYEWMLSQKRSTTTPANLTPTVSAGPDKTITLPANDLTLSGTASDGDGSISQYQWTKVAGPVGGTITSPAAAQTTIADVTEGIYTYRLTVKDNDGATAYDDVKITVNGASNLEPLANAGNDTIVTLPVSAVNLRGSGTDADGTIETYMWTKVSGPAQGIIADNNAAHTTVSGLAPGVYTFRLSVTDNNGATTTDEVNITVKDATVAIAKAGRDTLVYKNQTQPDNVVLNGRASMGGTSYEWTQISGPGASQIADATAPETYVSDLEEGTYRFKLTVNGNASDTIQVFVRDWQKKNVNPCRPGGGKAFIVPENYPGQYTRLYFNRDNVLGEKIMGGDTLYFKGGTYSAFEIGDFGGGEGCPVYIMPKDKPLVIIDGYFRIGVRDSNVVRYAVLDGTNLRSKGYPYGFFIDNRTTPKEENNYSGLVACWVSDFTVKGYRSINTGIMQIKLDATPYIFGRYDKFVQKHIKIQDNFLDGSSGEGLYIGNTASNGGQLNNPYGPPPRMDSVEISNNIVMNCGWDGIQLANARTGAVIKHNLVYKSGLVNQPSQRAGILMGGNTTGVIDSNIVINSKGNGIQVFGYGAVKVHNNVVDSIYAGSGDQDGIYQSHISILPETYNIPLSVNNFGNLISRVERVAIKVANNSGTMIPGHTYYNTFIHPTIKDANTLVAAQARDAVDNNRVIASFPYKINSITTKEANTIITMTQGDATESFTSVKEVVDWLFQRLNGTTVANKVPVANAGTDKVITLPLDSALLSGSGADIDGSIATYQWKQTAGPSVAGITTPAKPQTFVTKLATGIYKFELTVTDNGNATHRDTVMVTVKAPISPIVNKVPDVYAGSDLRITLPVNAVTLKGTATDEDGTITGTQWTKISGPAAYRIASASSLQTSADSLAKGIYLFELRATDDKNAAITDTVKVTVLPDTAVSTVNALPIAIAGADQTVQLPVNTVTLQGSGADADGTIDSYRWQRISGPSNTTLSTANNQTTNVSGLIEGVYAFQFTVTDNMGGTKTDTVQVTVLSKVNSQPLANAGADQAIQLPQNSIILNGMGADADGTIENYTWRKISGPAISSFTTAATAQTQVRNLTAGTYKFELQVTDNEGADAVDTMQLTVTPAAVANKVPVAYAGNDFSIQLPTNTAILSGSGLDEDGVIKLYQWTQVSGPSTATSTTPKAPQTTVKGLVQGTYQFRITVTDDAGATSSDVVNLTVKAAAAVVPNKAPVANAGKDITITLPVTKAKVTGLATDADGSVQSFIWTKVSGSAQYAIASPQAAQTEIRNLAKGSYQFELKVTDNKGAISRDTLKITVNAAATRPMFVMNAGEDQVIFLPTDSVELQGVADDPYNTVVSYNWKKVNGPQEHKFSRTRTPQTMVTGLVEGVYLFECKAKDENGNILSDTVQVTVKILEKSTVTLFPNPATSTVNVKIEANTRANNTVITLYDLSGRAVYREEFMRNTGLVIKQLDISKLNPGFYTMEVVTDINNRISTKLVKQ